METTIEVNGKPVIIQLTNDQVAAIKKASTDVKDRIKVYEDACADQGIKPLKLSDFDFLPEIDREYHYYDHRIVTIKRSLNEGWVADHSDHNQTKYTVWFKRASGSGAGFSFLVCDDDDSFSVVGARHEFKSRELGEYFAKQFSTEVDKCFILKK